MGFDEFQDKKPGGMGDDPPMGGGSDDFGFDDENASGGFGFDEDTSAKDTGGGMGFGSGIEDTEYEGGSDYGAASVGSTSFFGFFKRGFLIALLRGDEVDEVAADPKAFVPALVIYTLPSVIMGVLLFAMVNVFAGAAASGEAMAEMPAEYLMFMPFLQKASIGLIIFLPLMAIIGSIVGVFILHVFAKLFKGEGGFLDYYQTMGVGSLISWGGVLPYVGMLFSLWMLPVSVVITSRVHNISVGRSVAVVLLPLILMLVIGIALVSMLGMAALMGGGMGGGMQGM